jgi:hypothetical protein
MPRRDFDDEDDDRPRKRTCRRFEGKYEPRTEPGSAPATADLHFLDRQGTITLSAFGPFGGNWKSGTQVYVGNHVGFRNVPGPISNTLTLP